MSIRNVPIDSYSKFAEDVRGEMSEEEQAAALQAAAFFLLVSAPRKASRSGAEWEAAVGLLFAMLGRVNVPPKLWRGGGWYFADRASRWAEENLLPLVKQYPKTQDQLDDLAKRYHLYYFLGELIGQAR